MLSIYLARLLTKHVLLLLLFDSVLVIINEEKLLLKPPIFWSFYIWLWSAPYTYGTVVHVPSIPERIVCVHSTRRYFQK